VVIQERDVADVHLRLTRSRIDLYVVIRDDGGPEDVRAEAIAAVHGADFGTVAGVDVVREVDVVYEVRLTSINVQSYFNELALVEMAVQRLVFTLHEAQIGVPESALAVAGRAGALHAHAAVEAVEVGDLVRLVAEQGRHQRIGVGRSLKVLVDVH